MKRFSELSLYGFILGTALVGAGIGACDGARAADAGDDTTPPRLTAFTMPAKIDATAAGADARFTWSGTDANGSGVTDGYGWVIGPHGQVMYFWIGNGVAANKVGAGRAAIIATPWSEPGTWTLGDIVLRDAAGNQAVIDAATVAAFGGSTQFTLANRKGGDALPPTLLAGTVRTPTFSLAAIQKGTPLPAQFVVDLHVKDDGEQISGVRSASVQFCTADVVRCWSAVTVENIASGAADLALAAWQRPAQLGVPPGTYLLREVDIEDHAGNAGRYLSTDFGGTTDFAPIFNVTTLTLTP